MHPGIIDDLAVFIEGYVKINPHQHVLCGHIDILYGFHVLLLWFENVNDLFRDHAAQAPALRVRIFVVS
jgi:hypothetical protein